MRYIYLLAILVVFASGVPASAKGLQSLVGTWAESSCSSEPWEIARGTNGQYQIYVNEWGCNLGAFSRHGNMLLFHTTCGGEGSGEYRSDVAIEIIGHEKIRFTDGARATSTRLHRCP